MLKIIDEDPVTPQEYASYFYFPVYFDHLNITNCFADCHYGLFFNQLQQPVA